MILKLRSLDGCSVSKKFHFANKMLQGWLILLKAKVFGSAGPEMRSYIVFSVISRISSAAPSDNWGGGPRGNFGWNGTNGAIAGTAGNVYGAGNPGQQASSGGQHQHQSGNRGNRKGVSAR